MRPALPDAVGDGDYFEPPALPPELPPEAPPELPPVMPELPPEEPAPEEPLPLAPLAPLLPLAPDDPPPPPRSQPTAVMLSAARTSKIFDVVLIAFILVPFMKIRLQGSTSDRFNYDKFSLVGVPPALVARQLPCQPDCGAASRARPQRASRSLHRHS
ncbi:hypothetical protein [Noviherbaspirillum aridicola]|nr:hypothetical protein [Noviherbaspirillum aridicola]